MPRLQRLINERLHAIREARARYRRLGVLWSMGKDSTLLLWLCRKAFLGAVPFPVIHLDTGRKLPEMVAFREQLAREWGLDLRVMRNEAALARGVGPETAEVLACCQALKTEALRQAVAELGLEAVLLGIGRRPPVDKRLASGAAGRGRPGSPGFLGETPGLRRSRSRPTGFSRFPWRDAWPQAQPVEADRVLQAFLEKRSAASAVAVEAIIGELAAAATPERSGRAQDKEEAFAMQKLRSLGYM
jgi:sulfate adenylyltransferase subunit 2